MAAAYTRVTPIRWDDSRAELVWLDNSQIPWKEEYISSKDPERLIKASITSSAAFLCLMAVAKRAILSH